MLFIILENIYGSIASNWQRYIDALGVYTLKCLTRKTFSIVVQKSVSFNSS